MHIDEEEDENLSNEDDKFRRLIGNEKRKKQAKEIKSSGRDNDANAVDKRRAAFKQ